MAKTRQRQDKIRRDEARQGKTRQDKTRQDKTRQDKTRQDKAIHPNEKTIPIQDHPKTREDKSIPRQDKTRQIHPKTRQDNSQDKTRYNVKRSEFQPREGSKTNPIVLVLRELKISRETGEA
jgi:hypothetical protein